MTNEVRLPYGKGAMPLHLDAGLDCQIIRAKKHRRADSAEAIVREALAHPIGAPTLAELTKDVKRITVITNDNTRPMPSQITLPILLDSFFYPETSYDITILVATGLHRPMTGAEMEEQYGAEFCRTHRVVNHDARNAEKNVRIGVMSTGNPLDLDKIAAESDLILSEGFIEPHFFAGFSGGRKSILPGIAGMESIMNNHCPQNIANPHARQAVLSGNPIHTECEEAARLAGLRFILNVALNEEKQIVAAFAGDPILAHASGCAFVEEAMTVPVRRTDIVVTSNNGYPLDRNLYQAVKGIDTAAKVARDGGVIIIAAQCMDGVGHGGFGKLLQSCASIDELAARMSVPPLAVDKWQVQVMVRALQKCTLILVNDTIDEETLNAMFIRSAPNLDAALEMALAIKGRDASVSVMPDGPVTIPNPDGGNHTK